MRHIKYLYIIVSFFFFIRPDSCGFEHVFVGETRHGKEILGLHNWVQFYLQEKRNQIDYKGYVARKNKTRVRTSLWGPLQVKQTDSEIKVVMKQV